MKLDFLTPQQWEKVLGLHSELARKMGRGFLRCLNCDRREVLTPTLVEEYFREGWPVCCAGTLKGGTMNYFASEETMRKELDYVAQ